MRLYCDCERSDSSRRFPPYEGDEIDHFSTPQWERGKGSNLRPLGYEPSELPTALPRDIRSSFWGHAQVHDERKCKNGQTKWPMASRWLFIPPVCNHLGEHHFDYPVLTRMAGVTGTEGRIRTFDLPLMRRALLPTELLRHIVRLKTTPWLVDLIPQLLVGKIYLWKTDRKIYV